jgi:hypothetical protein
MGGVSTKVEVRTAYSMDVFRAGAEGRSRTRAVILFIGRSRRSSQTMLTRCLGEIGTGVEWMSTAYKTETVLVESQRSRAPPASGM